MAKKDQNVMLLQEVVGQLRKLNASSVRDRLREAEEAKRAEKIALQGDVQEEQQIQLYLQLKTFVVGLLQVKQKHLLIELRVVLLKEIYSRNRIARQHQQRPYFTKN